MGRKKKRGGGVGIGGSIGRYTIIAGIAYRQRKKSRRKKR